MTEVLITLIVGVHTVVLLYTIYEVALSRGGNAGALARILNRVPKISFGGMIDVLVPLVFIGSILYALYDAVPNFCWGISIIGVGIFLWSRLGDWQKTKRRTANDEKRNSLQPLPRPITSKPYAGHVYLIREEHGQYKIGRSVDVPTRFNTLKIQVPQEIELVWSIKCHDHKRAEKELQQKIQDK